MPDVIQVDDGVDAAALAAIRDGVLASKLMGESPLGGTFLATRGFSITFHRAARADVEARFPYLAPFLALALDRFGAEHVQRRPFLGGPPVPNAFYLNVLVVPPGASVGQHVDATLGPPNGSVVPEAVSVLYLDVPDDMQGGRLLLVDPTRDEGSDGGGGRPCPPGIAPVEPRTARYILFAGRLAHAVEAVDATRPRTSIVCEQYALAPGVLSAVPRLKVHARGAFARVLDDVRARRAMGDVE